MPAKSPIQLKSVTATEESVTEADVDRLRDQVALLRQSVEARWQEIAVLTRMVETLEAEKIEDRSAYDKTRRSLEAEMAALRRKQAKAGKSAKPVKEKVVKVEKTPDYLLSQDEGYYAAYQEVINSTSWKVTAPLRKAVMALRRLRGRV